MCVSVCLQIEMEKMRRLEAAILGKASGSVNACIDKLSLQLPVLSCLIMSCVAVCVYSILYAVQMCLHSSMFEYNLAAILITYHLYSQAAGVCACECMFTMACH